MPLDASVERFLHLLAATRPRGMRALTLEQRREGLAQLMKFSGASEPVQAIDERFLPGASGPIGARVYSPVGVGTGPIAGMVYLHGGGMVAGSVGTHDSIARALAHGGRCRIVSIEYRLAPEHPFPAALDDALAATLYVGAHSLEFGIDPARLGICGDSAGGTLAAATCHAWASLGRPALALQLLICPILDYVGTTASKRDLLARGYLMDQATLDHDLAHYLGGGGGGGGVGGVVAGASGGGIGLGGGIETADHRISPLRAASWEGLPPTLVHTAEFDPLRDEGREYFERVSRSGSGASYTCHPGMIHLFYGLGSVVPYARAAFDQIGKEIRQVLG